MYRVMIVDDEPPLIRSLRRSVEKNSTCFEVAAEAFNGSEALEKIAEARPDVIFTDIKMPLVDGISLITRINQEYSDVFPVIVSGYQDFDYARAALKAGVVDYLVKPVDAASVAELLSELKNKLDDLYSARRVELLQGIMDSQSVDPAAVQKYLNFDGFLMLLVLKGAPTFKRSSSANSKNSSVACLLDSEMLSSQFGTDNLIFVRGRNENECILCSGLNKDRQIDAAAMAKSINDMLKDTGVPQFFTTVYSQEYLKAEHIPAALDKMYKAINRKLVAGKTQLIDLNSTSDSSYYETPILASNTANKLSVLFQNKSAELLKEELAKLFQSWEKAAYPLTHLEKLINQIMQIFEKNSPSITVSLSLSIDQQLEEVFSQSADFEEIFRGVWDIVEELLGTSVNKTDISDDLIDRIEAFIKSNLSEPLSLQRVCELFGLSQPYLSRLFRKNKDMSFNEYVTYAKITEAKRLIVEQPEILMKDIAEIVGYQDQHYFSRVFKSLTGSSPTEFRK